MNAVRSLPIRLAPVPGEAIDSWLEALAHRNHTAFADILAAVGLTPDVHRSNKHGWIVQTSPEETRAVGEATGAREATISAMTLSHYTERAVRIEPKNGTVSRAFPWGRGRGSRYCPDCLAETSGRWQLSWRLGWAFACLQHKCLLADGCPECGRTQRVFAHIGDAIPAPSHCAQPDRDATGRAPARCGAALANTPVLRLDGDHPALAAQQIVYDVIEADTATFGVYRNNPVPSAHALADIRAVAARVLTYATDEELESALPADLLDSYRDLRMQLQPRSGRTGDKPGLFAPAHAVTVAVGATAALTMLNMPDVATAGRAMQWLVRGGRERGLIVCPTNIGWSHRATSTLTAVQLASLGPFLKLSDQLRYRVAAAVPARPPAGSKRADHLVCATPTMFWSAWSLRLAVAGCRHRYQRRVLSAALLLVGTRLRLQQAVDRVCPEISGTDVSRLLQLIQKNDAWETTRAALTQLADHLGDREIVIDYDRRRQVDYTDLLPDNEWAAICRETGATGATRNRSLVARCFLFEKLSGLPARAAPFAIDDWEFRDRVADFPKYLTPELDTALRRHAEEFLAVHHIRGEPAMWQPSTAVLDELEIKGHNPAGVDISELHRLIRRKHHSIAEAARRLHTTRDVIRYVLEIHPASLPEPITHPPPPTTPGPKRPRPAEAYQKARLQLERDEFINLYEHERLTLRDIGARVGVSRGVVTRLAHDYGISIRKPDDRVRHAIDHEWLYDQYITQHRTLPDIAQQCGLTAPTVARWAKIFGIPLRPKGGASHVKTSTEQQVAERAPALLRPALASSGGWDRLQRFADATHYPTLTVAAHELGLQQGRLVVQIKRIERELGHPLIIRAERGRPMQLTDIGNQVVEAVDELCRLSDR